MRPRMRLSSCQGRHDRVMGLKPMVANAFTGRRAFLRRRGERAPGRTRTGDARFRKAALYPLSYGGWRPARA